MLRRIINFFKRLFQRLLGRPQPSPATTSSQPSVSLTDTEYEALFLQLLEQVYQGASRGQVKGWLMGHKINEAELVAWLERFSTRLQENPVQHEELAERMVMLASLDVGELGDKSGRIGRNLLSKITPTLPPPEPTIQNPIIEAEFVGNGLAQSSVSEAERTSATVEGVPESEMTGDTQPTVEVKPIIEAEFVGTGVSESSIAETENFAVVNTPELTTEEVAAEPEVTVSQAEIEAWFEQGVEQYENEDFETALLSFNKVLEQQPTHASAWYYRGNILRYLDRVMEALDCFNQAVYHQPNYADAWNDGGSILEQLGRMDDALYCYEKATELQPNVAYIWKNRGNVLLDLGQLEQALTCYNHAVELEPDYLKAWYNRGIVLIELEQFDEALFSFNQAIELDQEDADSWYNRGIALERLGRMKEAVEAFEKAQELQPENV